MERKARPTFAICGPFSGANESAIKWLKKFDLEMEDYRDGADTMVEWFSYFLV